MAVNGLDAYRDAVEAGLSIAERAAERIGGAPHVELVRDGLSIVMFRRPGWAKVDYETWSERLLRPDRFRHTDQLGGRDGGAFAFLHPNTTMDMIDEILDTMR